METKEHMSEAMDRDRPGVGDAAAQVKRAVGREIEDARDRAAAGAETLRGKAAEATGGVTGLVTEQAERRKEDAAEGLRTFAQAIRSASDELGSRDQSMAARLVQEAAQGLERLSGGLQARSVTEMTREAATFGRTHPATFLAGCLIAGVAAGRIFATRDDDDVEPYPAGGYGQRPTGDYGQPTGGYGQPATGGQAGGQGYGSGAGYGSGVGYGSDMGGAGGIGGAAGSAGGADATRQAGTFGGVVAPASGMGAPGDGDDALATRMDPEDRPRASDTVLGEPPVGAVPFTSDEKREGGRDGEH